LTGELVALDRKEGSEEIAPNEGKKDKPVI